ncbi:MULTISPECIES: PEP/pyruvate-binding domain-containing protein [Paraburkholderia]|uniref:Putative Pyruvate, phosphate dikinase n=1 Tax=Paraburkholderia dioscoreae TaxID=2604047 RepID=A0A5Q4YVD8_9BURK|nr:MULTISPECIES: PEP/pyruvate-binding domain-containing protein [Paraburkholderia]MDR8402099.1 PEP-utilizing enzyme [Paraburkholderia sp. USG1]VVD31705.1 putative Pyruvate, phosphate dikinase [Paraburkholderia dioscoreae]
MTALQPDAVQLWPDEVYLIGCDGAPRGNPDPAGASAEKVGFKAYNLLRMAELDLPVPPAFVLGTHYCRDAQARETATASTVWEPGLHELERTTGQRFGDARQPLLLSVRSGAPVSMPGMMDTLLNVGLCDTTLAGMLRQTGNPRLVWDTYRRLVASYGELVAGVPSSIFEAEYTAFAGTRDEHGLDFAELRELTHRCLAAYERAAGQPFPQDPQVQLANAIGSVLASWQSDRACAYRKQCGISDAIGTAVTVQTMVFGNAGGRSGAGVGFTRDPVSGEPKLWVDFLFNAQGEDVVSGRRSARGHEELAQAMPAVWKALQDAATRLEHALDDMQDVEFTVQDARLYMLQTRNGKRTPQAAARIALDLLDEGVISADVARERTAALKPAALTRTRIVASDDRPLTPLAHAASASNGVAAGEIAFDEARARTRHAAGASVVLVRRDAETDDIAALEVAAGLLTQRGARTSHAAVVARQLGKVCLVGCTALRLDESARTLQLGDTVLHEGDEVTLDGNDGAIYAGTARTVVEPMSELQARLERLRAP